MKKLPSLVIKEIQKIQNNKTHTHTSIWLKLSNQQKLKNNTKFDMVQTHRRAIRQYLIWLKCTCKPYEQQLHFLNHLSTYIRAQEDMNNNTKCIADNHEY